MSDKKPEDCKHPFQYIKNDSIGGRYCMLCGSPVDVVTKKFEEVEEPVKDDGKYITMIHPPKVENDTDGWVSVKDRLPERIGPQMWYNDDDAYEVMFENVHATVLGYKEGIGVYKAVYDRYGNWSEVSTNSINGTIKPTHWMPLPNPPHNPYYKMKQLSEEEKEAILSKKKPQAPEGAEEILKNKTLDNDNLCLAGMYTLEHRAIIEAMHEYSSLQNKVAQDRIKELEEDLADSNQAIEQLEARDKGLKL